MRERKLAEILGERENLQAWIQEHGAEVWNLTELATEEQAYKLGRTSPLLLARTSTGKKYLLQSKPGHGKNKQDSLLVWLWPDNLPLGEGVPTGGDVVTINVPRANMGRPRRTLTASEKETILEARKGKTPINEIAKNLKCSNHLIINFLKENEHNGKGTETKGDSGRTDV